LAGAMPVDLLIEQSEFLPVEPDELGENVEFF
jgi:hypothetical protein